MQFEWGRQTHSQILMGKPPLESKLLQDRAGDGAIG